MGEGDNGVRRNRNAWSGQSVSLINKRMIFKRVGTVWYAMSFSSGLGHLGFAISPEDTKRLHAVMLTTMRV